MQTAKVKGYSQESRYLCSVEQTDTGQAFLKGVHNLVFYKWHRVFYEFWCQKITNQRKKVTAI